MLLSYLHNHHNNNLIAYALTAPAAIVPTPELKTNLTAIWALGLLVLSRKRIVLNLQWSKYHDVVVK